MTIRHYGSNARMSAAVAHGSLVYVSALAAPDQSGSVAAQTRNILQLIDKTLAEAGTSKARLLQASVWLADIGAYDTMNTEWDTWIAGLRPPARTCAETRFSIPEILVEISAIAALP